MNITEAIDVIFTVLIIYLFFNYILYYAVGSLSFFKAFLIRTILYCVIMYLAIGFSFVIIPVTCAIISLLETWIDYFSYKKSQSFISWIIFRLVLTIIVSIILFLFYLAIGSTIHNYFGGLNYN